MTQRPTFQAASAAWLEIVVFYLRFYHEELQYSEEIAAAEMEKVRLIKDSSIAGTRLVPLCWQ